MKEKLQAIGIGVMAWCCFFEAIIAPSFLGVPATLNLFGVVELQITVSVLELLLRGYISPLIVFLLFLYVAIPIFMGVLFIYYTCLYAFTPKTVFIPVAKEDVDTFKETLEKLQKKRVSS